MRQRSEEGFIPVFIRKIYDILSDEKYEEHGEVVRWSEKGDSFLVVKPKKFSKDIAPKYFKQHHFSSFVRQLNIYGFNKVNKKVKNKGLCEFRNINFLRNRKDLLHKITRKVSTNESSSTKQTENHHHHSESNLSKSDDSQHEFDDQRDEFYDNDSEHQKSESGSDSNSEPPLSLISLYENEFPSSDFVNTNITTSFHSSSSCNILSTSNNNNSNNNNNNSNDNNHNIYHNNYDFEHRSEILLDDIECNINIPSTPTPPHPSQYKLNHSNNNNNNNSNIIINNCNSNNNNNNYYQQQAVILSAPSPSQLIQPTLQIPTSPPLFCTTVSLSLVSSNSPSTISSPPSTIDPQLVTPPSLRYLSVPPMMGSPYHTIMAPISLPSTTSSASSPSSSSSLPSSPQYRGGAISPSSPPSSYKLNSSFDSSIPSSSSPSSSSLSPSSMTTSASSSSSTNGGVSYSHSFPNFVSQSGGNNNMNINGHHPHLQSNSSSGSGNHQHNISTPQTGVVYSFYRQFYPNMNYSPSTAASSSTSMNVSMQGGNFQPVVGHSSPPYYYANTSSSLSSPSSSVSPSLLSLSSSSVTSNSQLLSSPFYDSSFSCGESTSDASSSSSLNSNPFGSSSSPSSSMFRNFNFG